MKRGYALSGRLLVCVRSEKHLPSPGRPGPDLLNTGIALPNDASIALHRKLGFTDVGVFEEYARKNGRYVSSLWMQLRFG